MLPIRARIHQRVDLASIARLDANHPTGTVRIGVYQRGLLVEPIVDGDDFAGDRRKQLRDGFHGLDGPEHIVLVELRSDLRKLDVNDVAQLSLSIVGDADLGGAVFTLAHELVLFGVTEVARDVRHKISTKRNAPAVGREVYPATKTESRKLRRGTRNGLERARKIDRGLR